MPDWTKKNFGDLPDVSPQEAGLDWRFAREALGSPELGVSRFTYGPGARMPWAHRHRVHRDERDQQHRRRRQAHVARL